MVAAADGDHPELAVILDRVAALLASGAGTGSSAAVVAAAPGRVNLIGEHTDYNDGFVLPVAINRWCVAAGRVRLHDPAHARSRIYTENLDQAVDFDLAQRDVSAFGAGTWPRYLVGAVWSVLDSAAAGDAATASHSVPSRTPLDIIITSTVPLGSGLASSAASTVATAALASRLLGLNLPPAALAAAARHAERTFAGVPCGIMDQDISAGAQPGRAMLIDCRDSSQRSIALPPAEQAVIVIAHSGVRHALASGEYAARRDSCRRAAAAMGVPALRDATLAQLDTVASKLSEHDAACARHVITENARVLEFTQALAAGDLPAAGRLMLASHASLRDLYRVSCPELDTMVAAAADTPGVFGSRLTGGGFGGCTVTLCRPDAAAELTARLRAAMGGPAAEPPFIAQAVSGVQSWSL